MRNILEVKNLVRSYNTATFRDSKNNVNVLKGISFPSVLSKVVLPHPDFPMIPTNSPSAT